MRPALVAAIMLLALAGCGGGGEPAGSPEDTARSYVASLNHKDGTRFCALVAPYIAGESTSARTSCGAPKRRRRRRSSRSTAAARCS